MVVDPEAVPVEDNPVLEAAAGVDSWPAGPNRRWNRAVERKGRAIAKGARAKLADQDTSQSEHGHQSRQNPADTRDDIQYTGDQRYYSVPRPAATGMAHWVLKSPARRLPTSNPTAIQPNSRAMANNKRPTRLTGINIRVMASRASRAGATITVKQPIPPAAAGSVTIDWATRWVGLAINIVVRTARAANARAWKMAQKTFQIGLKSIARFGTANRGKAKVRGILNNKLPLAALFTFPSISALAERLKADPSELTSHGLRQCLPE